MIWIFGLSAGFVLEINNKTKGLLQVLPIGHIAVELHHPMPQNGGLSMPCLIGSGPLPHLATHAIVKLWVAGKGSWPEPNQKKQDTLQAG